MLSLSLALPGYASSVCQPLFFFNYYTKTPPHTSCLVCSASASVSYSVSVCVCVSERACRCLCGLWMCVVAGVTVKRGRQQRQRRTTWESVVANIAISLTRTLLWHSVDKLPMFDSLFLPLWWITAHAGVGEALCLAPHRGARPNIHAHTHTHTQAHARTHMHMLHTLQMRPGRQQQQPTVYQNK